MAEIIRVKARWTGFTGSPGYSIFHFRTGEDGQGSEANAPAAAAAVRTFFNSIVTYFPMGVTITVENDVESLLQETGELLTIYSGGNPAPVVGAASSATTFAAPAGCVVNWSTGGIRKGRRVRGRTFLVPLASTAFANDGTLAPTFLTAAQGAAATLASQFSGTGLVVFARPTTKGAADGDAFFVNTSRIPDKAAILSSRRD